MPRRSALREEPIPNPLHFPSYKKLSRCILALEKLALFALLQRKRLRHRNLPSFSVSVIVLPLIDPLYVAGWPADCSSSSYRPAAFRRVRPAQVEIAVSIDDKRPSILPLRAVVFNRRRLLADLDIDMLAAPNSCRNTLHVLRFAVTENKKPRRITNRRTRLVMPTQFHEIASKLQRRKDAEKLSSNSSRSTHTAGENEPFIQICVHPDFSGNCSVSFSYFKVRTPKTMRRLLVTCLCC